MIELQQKILWYCFPLFERESRRGFLQIKMVFLQPEVVFFNFFVDKMCLFKAEVCNFYKILFFEIWGTLVE